MAQGTIKDYDIATKVGTLLDDQAEEYAFDAASFEGSGVRMFRLGQRVKFDVEGEGARRKVRNLQIVTF